MKNLYQSALQNLKEFYMNHDDLVPELKYGVAPPSYMSTEPRFDKRPDSQATSASKRNSSMAPNPQAGTEFTGRKGDIPEQLPSNEDALPYNGRIPASPFANDFGYYKQDPRIKQANREVRVDGLGYPTSQFVGAESVFDTPQGPYDRDPGEVNSPIVRGTLIAYQGSAERFTNSPIEELGGSAFGPVPSKYQTIDEMDDPEAHPEHIWIQPHPNAITHTVGHNHPFKHQDRHYKPVEFATSVGDRGVR